MAEQQEFPFKVKNHRTGHERTVFSPSDLVHAEFDGYSQGPKPKAFTKTSREAVKTQAAEAAKAQAPAPAAPESK